MNSHKNKIISYFSPRVVRHSFCLWNTKARFFLWFCVETMKVNGCQYLKYFLICVLQRIGIHKGSEGFLDKLSL